jgi:S1-C subfamily serine protease
MVPPAKSKRVFETIYENHYHVNAESRSVVLVKAVRGPVGRLGLRRGDVVTHVNDIEWAGTAEELHSHLHQHFIQNPSDVISVTVNANRETAKFLKIRGGLIERSKQELL